MTSASTTKPTGPLAGIKVLDLSRVLAGPWCTQSLADLGADVIKVEHPRKPDDTRNWGRPDAPDSYFNSCNRNKRSLTVDFDSENGRYILTRLIKDADVLVENFKVGTLEKHGLHYEGMKGFNPRLIYCSITGYGQTGPDSHLPGYDQVIQARSGLMSLTGTPDKALKTGPAMVDLFAGSNAQSAILAALFARERTGKGQHIDISLLDVGISMLANHGVGALADGRQPPRTANRHFTLVPYQNFKTADGEIFVAVGNEAQYQRFLTACGRGALINHEPFATNALRRENYAEFIEIFGRIIANYTTKQWMGWFGENDVPCGPVNNLDNALRDPQVRHREMVVTVDDVSMIGNPIKLSDTPVQYRTAPPTHGQHTREILKELGIEEEQINFLQKVKLA